MPSGNILHNKLFGRGRTDCGFEIVGLLWTRMWTRIVGLDPCTDADLKFWYPHLWKALGNDICLWTSARVRDVQTRNVLVFGDTAPVSCGFV